MRSKKTNRTLIISICRVMLCLMLGGPAWADTLETKEYRVTASTAYETTPTLGNDGTTDLVVYTLKPVVAGIPGAGDIWYQPLVDGAPDGMPVQVTSGPTDDQLNDVSGDYIVYTAYDSVSSTMGAIMLYRISTGATYTLGRADIIEEAHIHGTTVVWREGGAFATMLMRYKLGWLGTGTEADVLAGPVPPTFDIQIGSRFAVWSETESGQDDIYAYDLDDELQRRITNTPGTDERAPATSGGWIVWQQTVHGETTSTIQAFNPDTLARATIADNGANYHPSIDGDLVAWESDMAGNLDIWLYRLSTGETFQVTSEAHDQYLNDVFGDMVAYVDMRRGTEDVYVSTLAFIPDNQPPAVNAISEIIVPIGLLEPGVLKNANMQNALINKLNAVIASIEAGSYADALDKLQNDILKKTDGCAIGGEPDKNDWIKNCDAQGLIYPPIIKAIQLLGG